MPEANQTVDEILDDDPSGVTASGGDGGDSSVEPSGSIGAPEISASEPTDHEPAEASQVPGDALPAQGAPEPQADYQQPQYDPQYLGAAYALGLDPSRIPYEQLPHAIQARYREQQQQIAWARQVAADPQYQEYLRSRGQAQEARPTGPAQGSAPAVSEPVDYRKALQEAFTPPAPPPFAKALLDGGHIVQTPTGKFAVAPNSAGIVSPDELAAVNKYVDDLHAHETKRVEALEKALDARLDERLSQVQQRQQSEQFIRQASAQDDARVLVPGTTTPTLYGRAYLSEIVRLQNAGVKDKAELIRAARQAGELAETRAFIAQARAHYQQQQYAAHYAQTYGQPPQTQTYSEPPQQAPPQDQRPQPSPSFIDRALQSPAGGAAGGNGKGKRTYKHEADLLGVFDEAIARLQG